MPCITLKISGIYLTSMGDTLTEVKVKNPEKYIYKKLFIKEGKPVAAIFLGDTKNAYEICQLIEKKVDMGKVKGKILETDFDIKSLLK